MPDPVSGAVGASVVGGVLSSRAQKKAASKASQAQIQSAEMSIEEQRRQFEETQRLMQPFLEAGYGALEGLAPFREAGATAFKQQQDLLGLNGVAAQQAAIRQLETSPMLYRAGASGRRGSIATGVCHRWIAWRQRPGRFGAVPPGDARPRD